MERLTVTPFGRQAVTAGLLASQAAANAPADHPRFAKWELFRALCAGRVAFGVRDRDLTVLNALLSFYRPEMLEDAADMIVYPSNKALAERAHGMAESTLRRHVAALVKAGLLLRHDSPNGKRYARRDGAGEVVQAFGFDLRPLLVRAGEILDAAEAARAEAEALHRLRERCVLMHRDAVKLLIYGRDSGLQGTWDAWDDALRLAQRALRRKPCDVALKVLASELSDMLDALQTAVMPVRDDASESEETSGKPAVFERHLQISKQKHLF